MRQFFITGLFCLLLSACASSPSGTGAANERIVQNESITPPAATNKAALKLLERSRSAALEGKLAKAEAYLERALRIDSRNAVLWHYMAKLRLKQGQLEQAAGLAAKSNSLDNTENNALQADNWRIIAHARYQSGDIEGARAAQQTADRLTE